MALSRGDWAPGAAQKLENDLCENINRRTGLTEANHICSVATILDPKFKTLPFMNVGNVTKAVHYRIYSCIAPTFFAEFYPQKHGWGVYMEH
jgi:hypothetical protein